MALNWSDAVLPEPLCDVVIPCRNYGHYVADAICSVIDVDGAAEGVGDVIVIDDDSTDDTAKVVGLCDGVRYQKINAHCPHEARRAGFHATQSAFVCFLDADDYLGEHYIEDAVNILNRDDDAVIAHTDLIEFGLRERRVELRSGDVNRLNYIHSGAVYRRSALVKSRVMDFPLPDSLNRWNDAWIARNVLACGGKAVWFGGRYFYRKHGGGISDRQTKPLDYLMCKDLELTCRR